jgi:hypothetical protein
MTPEIPLYYFVYLPASPAIYNLVFTTSTGWINCTAITAAPPAHAKFFMKYFTPIHFFIPSSGIFKIYYYYFFLRNFVNL